MLAFLAPSQTVVAQATPMVLVHWLQEVVPALSAASWSHSSSPCLFNTAAADPLSGMSAFREIARRHGDLQTIPPPVLAETTFLPTP